MSTRTGSNPAAETRLQYEQLVASIDGILWEADARTFRMTFVSQQAERLLGYPKEQWYTHNFWSEHIHPDDRGWAVEFCQRATREKRLHDFEYRMIAADGRVVWLRDIVTVIVEGGEPAKLRGIMVDTSDKKRVEQERQEHLKFLESLDRINRAIQGAADLDQMMRDVLDAVLAIFDCDRAWLVFPCDPTASTWTVPMECTRPEYPGAFAMGLALPLRPEEIPVHRALLDTPNPVRFGPGGEHPLAAGVSEQFGIRSMIATAIYPKIDKPYMFGLHQCSRPRVWTPQETRLFQEIGRRLADALTTLLLSRRMAESEARFRILVEHATDAFFLHDTGGTVLDVNRQACVSLGYTREELVGLAPSAFDMDVAPAEMHRIVSRLDAGEVIGMDTRHRRKDGTTFPVEVRVRPFWQGGKRLAVSLARDITDRKRAEEALAAREAVLRNLAESSPGLMGIYHARADGTICMPYTSPKIWDLFGLRPEDVVNDASPLLARTHPDDMARVRDSIAESARTMTPWRLEYRVQHPTRGELWLEGCTTPQPHPDGGVVWYGFIHDITDRMRLEEQFRQAQKMEAVGRLAGGIAHDFNNLLTVINGYGEMAFNTLRADDPNREPVVEIRKAGERAANLTRQLLAYSRKQMLQPQIVDLNALLGELHKLLRRLIGADVELTFTPDPALDLANVDPSQFEQAVINLAVNARDAMPGGGRLTIESRNTELGVGYAESHPEVRPGRYVLVTLSDTGHGMNARAKARIFEPFFTTKEPGKGTGLGLAMVYGFVKQSGGHVEVDSEVGRGTTFRVYLPRAEATTPSAKSSPNHLQMPTGTETVLLVEDEDSVRALSRIILQSCGYTVLEAEDGEEGLRVAEHHPGPIHLLVSDLVMPRMSGRRLADLLTEVRPDLRVLFLSGYTEEAAQNHGVLEPAHAFLQKPFSPMNLARKVREVLDAEHR